MSQTQRFFIALMPPPAIQDHVNQIKQHFADHYASCGALKSPPHITLQAPFEWQLEKIPALEQSLQKLAITVTPIPIRLEGFSAFPPRVIFINVLKTPELLTLQKILEDYLEKDLEILDRRAKMRPFVPHMTVVFRDLTKQNFQAAWEEFRDRPLYFEFTVAALTLLIHNGQRWNVNTEFPFRQVNFQPISSD